MADVPGSCDLPLTRAVVQYRDLHERALPGGRIRDIGLGLVLDGTYASSAHVIDLGSGSVRPMDLSSELVILDWVYEPTLDHVHELLLREASMDRDPGSLEPPADLVRYCSRIATGVLERLGFSYLTRPSLLRIGFRDVCRDLDLHDGTAFRLLLGERRVARIHMDYESGSLLVRTGRTAPDQELEAALTASFQGAEIRRGREAQPMGTVRYQVRFPVPLTLDETRGLLRGVRAGLEGLLARYEPARFRAVRELLGTLGSRDSLSSLNLRDLSPGSEPVGGAFLGQVTVH